MNKGKHDFQVEDWTKVRYIVKCHWGIEVGSKYPNPVIHELHFETFQDMEEFVSDYVINNGSDTKKIISIQEVSGYLNVETYEVATKVRVVRQKDESN